jgi:Right handed beta helix region
MPYRRFLVSVFILGLFAAHAKSQANVTENQQTYIYVDDTKGSDSNSGASGSPFKTVQAAVSKANTNNQKSIGTKVILNAGVYREQVLVGSVYKGTSVPLTIQAASAGTAVIAASDVLKNWVSDSGNSSVYSTPWQNRFGYCARPSGWPTNFASIALRTEMIFVDGVPLTQVMSYSSLQAGTFYVADGSSAIHVYPPSGTNMQTALVESATRTGTISVSGRSNVVLRGLVLRHARSCVNTAGAKVSNSNNVLIDSVQALWNNSGGLGIFSSSNVTLRNSIASHNGGVGFQGNQAQNVLMDFNESDYNNWRGAQAAFYDWAMGGTKLFAMRNVTVQNHFSYNNQAQGLWFDTDNKNITINNATLVGNVQAALQIERNEGPITLENSHLCSSGVGVNVLTSEKLTIKNNTFYNNGGTNKGQAEIFIAGQNYGINVTDWQTGQTYHLYTTGTVLSGNTFANAGSGQNVFGTYLNSSDWSAFADSLNASNNRWYNPAASSSFKIVNGKMVNLTGWQSATGTDYSSMWAAPTTSPVAACREPTASFADFNVNLDNRNYTMSGGNAVSTIRVNSFGSGAVSLRATGMPSGVSASIGNANLVSGVATLTLSATKLAANQTVPITLWATSGSRVHSVAFNVHVVPM